MSKLAEHIRELPSCRNPAYRPAATIDDEERAELAKKLGDAENYDLIQLREMVRTDPDNLEFRKAMVSGIASAEYAGIDSFSRKVCEWQDWDVPRSASTPIRWPAARLPHCARAWSRRPRRSVRALSPPLVLSKELVHQPAC